MKISPEVHTKKLQLLKSMDQEREDFRVQWKEVADYILPKRYTWLLSDSDRRKRLSRNPNIIDGTGTAAARILASGLLNGITSPARPWFRLKLRQYSDDLNYDVRRWLDEVAKRILSTMAGTNFYSSMAIMYLDLAIFGTNATLIYEDSRYVFRCSNSCLGEFYVANDSTGIVNRFAREFLYTLEHCVERFGIENLPPIWQDKFKQGGANKNQLVKVQHLIEPNDGTLLGVPKSMAYQELYWLPGYGLGDVLSARGYNEKPGIFPRWEVNGNDSYGTSPAMDAIGDIIQLQHESKRKAQSLDYMLKPPIKADIQLQNRPSALLPGGVTYIAGIQNVGAEPIYTVNPPIDALTLDIRDVQARIRDFFHNDLFTMISNLETVRTATEIDARREEKLVLLGPVLERFENEALNPAINRVYSIMNRAGLLPQAPAGLAGEEIEIQYVSILSAAQSAVGVAPIERWTQFVGQLAAVKPESLNIPNWEDLIRDYGLDIGVKAKYILSKEEAAAATQAQEALLKSREAANQGLALAKGAETLSKANVGGGMNMLQQMMNQ